MTEGDERLERLRTLLYEVILDREDLLAWLRSLPGAQELIGRTDLSEPIRERLMERGYNAIKWDAALLEAALASLPAWAERRPEKGAGRQTGAAPQHIENREAVRTQNIAGRDILQYFAAPVPPRPQPRKSNLPPRRHDFVGRETELAELHKLLTAGSSVALDQGPPPPSGLTGLGGVGKSTLATEYGYRHLGEYEHVCWVNAEGTDVAVGIAALADDPLSLGLHADTSTPDRASAVLARLERGGPHLLILDNVSEPESYPKLLPRTDAVRVIITTRRTDLHGVRRLQVEVLPEDGALRLMLGDLQVSDSEREAARQLCHELGCLTLAVAVASRLLETRQRTPSVLLALVQEKGPLGLPETRRAKDVLGTLPSVERLFDASVALLDESDPVDAHAKRLLWVGGWFAPEPIPLDIYFEAGTWLAGVEIDEQASSESLSRLFDLGLLHLTLERLPVFHRITADYARRHGGEKPSIAVLDALCERLWSVGEARLGELLKLGPLRPHLVVASSRLSADSPGAHLRVALKLAQHLQVTSAFRECREVCNAALSLGIDDPLIQAYFLHAQGRAAEGLGEYDEAMGLLRESLRLREESTGPSSPRVATAQHAIGDLLNKMGSYHEALVWLRRALIIRESGGTQLQTQVVQTLRAIGLVLIRLQRNQEAFEQLSRAHELCLKLQPEEQEELAETLHALGRALHRLGRFGEAEGLYIDALRKLERAYKPDHPRIAGTLDALARTQERQGLMSVAEATYLRALSIKEKAFKYDHPEVATTLHRLGELYYDFDRVELAMPRFQRALTIQEARLGPDHPETIGTRVHILLCRRALGEPVDISDAQRIMAQYEQRLGAEHLQVHRVRQDLLNANLLSADVLEPPRE